jgi:excisionase family DNA binding protein
VRQGKLRTQSSTFQETLHISGFLLLPIDIALDTAQYTAEGPYCRGRSAESHMEARRLTLREAVERYGIGRTTLYRWKRAGRLPFHREPGSRQVFVVTEELQSAMKRHRRRGRPASSYRDRTVETSRMRWSEFAEMLPDNLHHEIILALGNGCRAAQGAVDCVGQDGDIDELKLLVDRVARLFAGARALLG